MAYTRTIETLKTQEGNKWAIADALSAEVRSPRDWDALQQALMAEGIEYKTSTLKAYRRVAAIFPAEMREDGVSFAAHQAAATTGTTTQARVAMERAKAHHGKVTRDTVLGEVRQMKGRTTNSTSDAVAAWRDLRRGVEKLLDLPEAELEALLQLSDGGYRSQAPTLSQDLAKVSVRIADSIAKAEKAIKAREARRQGAAARDRGKTTPKAQPKAEAPASQPKVSRLGQRRGVK